MIAMKLFGCILIIVTFGPVLGLKKMIIPSIIICKRNDPQLSACVEKNFRLLLPIMKDGIPEMNIAPIDPVHVENVRMEFPPTRSVALTADLSNMMVWGLSNSTFNQGVVTPKDGALDMLFDLTIHHMKIESDYKSIGKFLLLAIDSVGNFSAKFDNIHMIMSWKSRPFMKKEKTHIKWDCDVEKLTFGKMHINFQNLFGNNTELTDNINKVINDNIKELYNEISPVVIETVKSVALNAVSSVYNLFPFDVLFPVD